MVARERWADNVRARVRETGHETNSGEIRLSLLILRIFRFLLVHYRKTRIFARRYVFWTSFARRRGSMNYSSPEGSRNNNNRKISACSARARVASYRLVPKDKTIIVIKRIPVRFYTDRYTGYRLVNFFFSKIRDGHGRD